MNSFLCIIKLKKIQKKIQIFIYHMHSHTQYDMQ